MPTPKIGTIVHYRPADEPCRSAICTQAGEPLALYVLPGGHGMGAQMVRPSGEDPSLPDAWHMAADCPDGV